MTDLRRERVLDGAKQDPGREALSESGRLRGGLPPAVQEAGLSLETGLGVGDVGPVEGLTVLLVRVEERTTGETLETRAGVRHLLLHLHPSLRSWLLTAPWDLLDHLGLLIPGPVPSCCPTVPCIAEVGVAETGGDLDDGALRDILRLTVRRHNYWSRD